MKHLPNLILCLFVVSVWGMASAGEDGEYVFPDLSKIEVRIGDKSLAGFETDPPKRNRFSFMTVPGIKPDVVPLKIEKDHIYFDTRDGESHGYRNVQMNFGGLSHKTMAKRDYCLHCEVQGPKGGNGKFYYEGHTVAGKHYYKSLEVHFNGTRQKIAFEQHIPDDLAELHMRFDFFTPGEYRFYPFSLKQETEQPVNAQDFKPELIFYAPFDGSADAAISGGDKSPKRAERLEWSEGVRGKSLRFSRENNAVLEYATRGNMDRHTGAVSVWLKPDTDSDPGKQTEIDKIWRTIVSMPFDGVTRIGSGAIWLWIFNGQLRADTSDMLDKYITSSFPKTGTWHHIVFCWNPWYCRVYVDGRELGGGGDSLNRAQPGHPRHYTPLDFQSFFVGNYNHRPFQGLVDELRVYSAPIRESEVLRLLHEFQTVALEPGSQYFMNDKPVSISGTVSNTSKDDLTATIKLLDADGKELVALDPQTLKANSSTKFELRYSDARPGLYTVVACVKDEAKQSYPVQVFDADRFHASRLPLSNRSGKLWDRALELKLVETIDPATVAPERIAVVGTLSKGELDGRTYVQTEGKQGQRFALRLAPLVPDKMYCFEWDVPDDMKRTVDIIAQSSKSSNSNEYELQTGYVTGDEYPCSGKIVTQRALYWPRSDDVSLVFCSARVGKGGAALAQVRVYEVTGPLPAAFVHPANPVDRRTRPVGIYFEDPAVHYDFGVDGGKSQYFETYATRLAAYMKYSGQNLLAYPVVWYNGMIGPKYMPRPHVPNFLDAYLTVFDREGLEFMATINQNNAANVDVPIVTHQGIDAGEYNDSIFSIHNTGTPHPGGWHGTPPIFNVMHPAIQKMTLDYFDEILAVGAKHPSFKGIIMHLPRHALHSLGDIKAGYNDYMIERFEKDTGTVIPVDHKAPDRGKLYYDWLMANARDKWVDWRCQQLAEWYKRLAEKVRQARPDLRLGINCMRPIIYEEDEQNERDSWGRANREAGIDAKYFADDPTLFVDQTLFPADYRWMEGRAEPERRDRLRNTEERPGMYDSLTPAAGPWIHMHDRYWESAMGNAAKNSDVSNLFHVDWLREHPWRVSTLNPVGVNAMKHYIMPLRYKDILGYTKGGFLIGTYGMESELVRFAQAYRALPAVPFDDVAASSETVRIRRHSDGKTTWFYIVNTELKPVEVTIALDAGQVVDLRRNLARPVAGGKLTLTVAPYELQSYSTSGDLPVTATVGR